MQPLCGCSYVFREERYYLPRLSLSSNTTILGTTSSTVLDQEFLNDFGGAIAECRYDFPLYDGVSVVSFDCEIGSLVIHGTVKERIEAKEAYKMAQAKGKTAALLEQGPTSDVFSTSLGNIPRKTRVHVRITYIGELKHDVAAESIRFTIPTQVAPRYGRTWHDPVRAEGDAISITVDVDMIEGSFIREVRSVTHPVSVTMGKTLKSPPADHPKSWQASVSLSQRNVELGRDFVLEIVNQAATTPKALLESHPRKPQDRALLATLVPSFKLPSAKPEIIIVADRSGSMQSKMPTLISALKIFLRSLPVGIHFNICSFGSRHSLLWDRSRNYDEASLNEATKHVETFQANYRGTETLAAIKASIEARDTQKDLALILCTDGDIWHQQELFLYLRTQLDQSQKAIRVFPLGIGNSVSSGLIEGVAKAGKGFASTVGEHEKIDAKVIRMLKAALVENLTDWSLEVRYEQEAEDDDDFVLVERVTDSLRIVELDGFELEDDKSNEGIKDDCEPIEKGSEVGKEPVSEPDYGSESPTTLPAIQVPKVLQIPQEIPPLYPSTRTSVYLLMSPDAPHRKPTSVVFTATSSQGPLEISIPVETLADPGETIHQLAARKAINELENGRGWLYHAKHHSGTLVREKYATALEERPPSKPRRSRKKIDGPVQSVYDKMVEREAVRLGVEYQVGGKWCSFVAVEGNQASVQPGNSYAQVAIESPVSYSAYQPAPTGWKPQSVHSNQAASGSCKALSATQTRGAPAIAAQASFPPAGLPDEFHFQQMRMHNSAPRPPRATAFSQIEEPLPPPPIRRGDALGRIISLQRFQGFWELDHALLDVCGVAQSAAAGTMQSSTEPLRKTVWATVLAIVFLERVLPADKEAWELVVDKAEGWLQNSGVHNLQAEMERSPLKELLAEIRKREMSA